MNLLTCKFKAKIIKILKPILTSILITKMLISCFYKQYSGICKLYAHRTLFHFKGFSNLRIELIHLKTNIFLKQSSNSFFFFFSYPKWGCLVKFLKNLIFWIVYKLEKLRSKLTQCKAHTYEYVTLWKYFEHFPRWN